ncbi:hypothetical protein COW36_10665 [bacterium (Candidatus Blackallbacteria) CG17_big_fil_post_rev_8_21_14_2_50_48_46]|uniref:Nucleotidyl transferase domain-containing protein n=1 Tax=bacterium (Candidatus Blackallbacteria) CG17_big_fil_post_rev_8_21_14_2_50_48_46 TaxID=2014261 RepID=A0A2M7G4S8_9BACT|nr:MAG: hypothetical protein COW64_20655 [bacterium (Candidatus Blackallbacteria) CG18_big_fil_WC_8_21_14_2_50_49_26]PIW16930.1 MAG: hypothetical protein COW36_10665 [bacterium (Candidatus Blackallbacteria) CG17_big_fil_post_rev_8_21_14_2_50_48_46]PIW50208.1 MAG: hypothetical protein COW20_03175 [bacterium (Candidatus Blackallbacteria) CG13_big_fil_rev_8_21_14_2_50_49_14]
MKALVICSEAALEDFQTLEMNPWLLPVAGKAVIEYQLETLGLMGLRDIRILGASPELEKRYGSGQALGLNLSYGALPSENCLAKILRQQLSFIQNVPLVLVQGLRLLIPVHAPHCLRLDQSFCLGEGVYGLTSEAVKAVLAGSLTANRLKNLPTRSHCISWALNNLKDYHRANLEMVSSWSSRISLPAYGQYQGFHCGSKLSLAKDLVCKGQGVIGNHSVIQSQVELQDAYLGQGVMVAQGTHILRTVVLDGTWIGPQLTLEDKIVVGRRLIDPLSEEVILLEEPGWLDTLQVSELATPFERFCAGFLWLLLLPFYAALAPSQPQTRKAYQLKNQTVDLPRFAQTKGWRSRLFARLNLDRVPALQAVMRNQMAWVGQAPVEKNSENPYTDYFPAAFAYSEWLGSEGAQALLDDASYPFFRASCPALKISLKILWRSLTKGKSSEHAKVDSSQETGAWVENPCEILSTESLMAQR